jgi:hypothetical protein
MAEIAKQIEGLGHQIPRLTLMAVIVAVLMPAANYSFRLSDPTPSQLLVAICIGVFSSVVCLWLLDAVSILRFRSEWVSRSVWGAAIVAILGTGVGVFQGAFAERKYPYEGQWMIRVHSPSEDVFIAERQAVLIYSQPTESYWGYSDTALPVSGSENRAISAEIVEFTPKVPRITVRLLFADGKQTVLEHTLTAEQKGARFRTKDTGAKWSITLARPR